MPIIRALIATLSLYPIICTSVMAVSESRLQTAIQSGTEFLTKSVLNDTYSLSCQSSDKNPCPFHNTGETLTAFFITKALTINQAMPDKVRDTILKLLDRNKQLT